MDNSDIKAPRHQRQAHSISFAPSPRHPNAAIPDYLTGSPPPSQAGSQPPLLPVPRPGGGGAVTRRPESTPNLDRPSAAAAQSLSPLKPMLAVLPPSADQPWSPSVPTAISPPAAPIAAAAASPIPPLSGNANVERTRGWKKKTTLLGWFGAAKLSIEYVRASSSRSPRSFLIGLSTVFLVVTFLTLVQNALVRSSIVFVKLSEDTVGQYDLLLTPSTDTTTAGGLTSAPGFLNYTQLNHTLGRVQGIAGCAPRWILPVNLTVPKTNAWDTNAPENEILSSAYVLVMDSVLERAIGVGVAWPHRPLGDGEAHITGSLLRTLKRRPAMGDQIQLVMDLLTTLNTLTGSSTSLTLPASTTNNNTVTLTSAQVTQLALVLGIPRQQLIQSGIQLPDGRYQFTIGGLQTNAAIMSSITSFRQPLTAVSAIDLPVGKYPQALGNVVVMDQAYAETRMRSLLAQFGAFANVSGTLPAPADFRLPDYAMSIVCMVANRSSIYAMSTTDRQRALVRITDAMAMSVGLSAPFDTMAVLSSALQGTQFIQIFMSQIFFTVVTVLSVLAAMLIYSLLLADVEEKTFEYGMLRSLGMEQSSLIGLLITQSLGFSVPAIVAGLVVCLVIYTPVEYILSTFAFVPMQVGLSTSAWALGLTLGLGLPVLGMLVPIQRALSQTLRDALDVYHNVVFDSIVTVKRLRDIGIDPMETAIASLLVVVGFLVYYVIPLSFTFGDLDLFFRILTIILLGMVLGQVFVGQMIQHYLSLIAMRLVVFMVGGNRSEAITSVVAKNLSAHLKRNGKTALMLTILLAYIIFAAVMFRIQAATLAQTLEWTYGADLVVRGASFKNPVPEARISNYLATVVARTDSPIAGWTYLSYPLTSYYPVRGTRLGPVAPLYNPSVKVIGVQKSFLDVALSNYYIPVAARDGLDPRSAFALLNDTVESTGPARTSNWAIPDNPPIVPASALAPGSPTIKDVYTDILPILISESLASTAFIGADTTRLLLEISYTPNGAVWSRTQSQLVAPLVIARKVPGISGISRLAQSNTPSLIAMPRLATLLRHVDTWAGSSLRNATTVGAGGTLSPAALLAMPDAEPSVPKQTAFVKLKQGLSALQVEGAINSLNTAIGDQNIKVDNLRFQLQSTDTAAFFINILFYVVAFVGILLSFFVLWLSFTANLRENAWEFGVLRALGMDSSTVIDIYIYEAVAVVLATIAIGTTVGIVTAITLTMQFNLFTEMPFTFSFPTGIYLTVVLSALIISVTGSWVPATGFARKKIAMALKGL
ncbi:hypothetical protein BC828DRAFT_383053 [Blastocladiella britannica]|nr:hypothetical protein BC828DRAFT_383053 [Blastocladiella britannica]